MSKVSSVLRGGYLEEAAINRSDGHNKKYTTTKLHVHNSVDISPTPTDSNHCFNGKLWTCYPRADAMAVTVSAWLSIFHCWWLSYKTAIYWCAGTARTLLFKNNGKPVKNFYF